jgi:kumamolisin
MPSRSSHVPHSRVPRPPAPPPNVSKSRSTAPNATNSPSSTLTQTPTHIPIPHSDYVPLADAKLLGPADPLEQITITLVTRPRFPVPSLHDDHSLASRLPRDREHLTREDFESDHGAHPDDLALIEKFAREHGFEIVETSAARHSVVLQGSVADFSEAFHVEMVHYDHARGHHRGINGPIYVPREIAGVVQAVLGLHDRPAARRHFPAPGVKRAPAKPTPLPPSTNPAPTRLSAHDLAEIYRFPREADGTGQCIGIVELGGGYHRSDLEFFFSSLHLPHPRITDVSVHGARNTPADRSKLGAFMSALTSGKKGAASQFLAGKSAEAQRAAELLQSTVETTMDVELVGAFAPGARIVVYFAPNNEQGIYHALTTALADKRNRPTVLSLSWGEPEPNLSPSYATLIDGVLKNLAHIGVTVCVSSGDFGAHNGSAGGHPSVNFPASSPYALGCGGTTLNFDGKKIESEIVWNSVFDGMHGATGGGVSRIFDRPHWQDDCPVPAHSARATARGVPDVAAVADPRSGCRILIGGVEGASSGTSAAAPLWAALVARLNQALGAHAGYLNSLLYRLSKESHGGEKFRAIIKGENGAYSAGAGWNACTGLGTPLGDRLLAALSGLKPN